MLKGKSVLIGVCGSIAAYKIAYLVRYLIQREAEVSIIMSETAKEFIGAATLSTLSQNSVYTGFYKNEDTGAWNNHVTLGLWADIYLIAPATANTISKFSTAQSDDFMTATYLSAKCETIMAPAMDLDMWQHPQNQENINSLKIKGVRFIEPESGELASGLEGKGRMAEPESIGATLENYFARREKLKGKRFIVTAGPTFEKLDPVRFVGNFSSGKMGIALSEALANCGAQVDLICGPSSVKTNNPKINRTDVVSADEMMTAVKNVFSQSDGIICSAAVSDYKPAEQKEEKIKKSDDVMHLTLVKNPDILKFAGENKHGGQVVIGFALETTDALEHAQSKKEKKNADYIVLNQPVEGASGFGSDTNQAILIDKNNKNTNFELMSKQNLAEKLVDCWIENEWND